VDEIGSLAEDDFGPQIGDWMWTKLEVKQKMTRSTDWRLDVDETGSQAEDDFGPQTRNCLQKGARSHEKERE
jgi:hypothetical protein